MRMACEQLSLLLRLIASARSQKAEAKPRNWFPRESSQGDPVMGRLEVAGLPSGRGSRLGRSDGRETPSLSKSGLSASSETGRVAAHAASGALITPVLHAITCGQWNACLTDEVPRRPQPVRVRVRVAYKSDTKGPPDAPAPGRGSPPPRPQGCRQRQSRGAGLRSPEGSCSERQNLGGPCGPPRFMGPVSPAVAATQWPDRTSSGQPAGSLRNSPPQPEGARATVRSR